ncbi:MAG: hypothetical protein CMF25_03350 [Kangiellaceae bacterium]|nr:hypothetical protein [Kangiellaceae bacterium]|tara:strand:+ start:1644 stop:3368 length:1725 start_codon:yes stop_codon:yes gene_type:complete
MTAFSHPKTLITLSLSLFLFACENQQQNSPVQDSTAKETSPSSEMTDFPATAYIEHDEVYNPESVIPPQCYTKTNGEKNPCYACHQTYSKSEQRPNIMDDGQLQGEYQFSDLGMTNHWKNLFVDRSKLITDISDDWITRWVNQDNYSDFIRQLESDKDWKGEIPAITDLAYPEKAFADNGLAKDGSLWVAYNYKPFPSTFWPTNGSTGDAMIRLDKPFRENQGQYQQDIYFANLALVEMALKDLKQLSIPALSEKRIGEDLNGNNQLEEAVYTIQRQSHYLGDASHIELAHMLYPENTEFLHTVRYIGWDDNGKIVNSPRMKEVRYMKKHAFKTKQRLAAVYYREAKEKHFENLPQTLYLGDKGINNGFGWTINGYIEDENGALRHQHAQELAFCNGCHKTIGATFDQTFSFARKPDGAAGWGYIDLTKMKDVPNIGDVQTGEYLTYMQRIGGGDEFRQNSEMLERWFTADGELDTAKVQQQPDVYSLITPSIERAKKLNKAYVTIMREQSYLFGRDATLTQAKNVLQQVDESQQPLQPAHRYQWDMRLRWDNLDNISRSDTSGSQPNDLASTD